MLRSIIVRSCFVVKKPLRIPSCTRNYSIAAFSNMASLGAPSKKHKVTIVGSGNWYDLHPDGCQKNWPPRAQETRQSGILDQLLGLGG